MITCMHGYLSIASLPLQVTFTEDDDDDHNDDRKCARVNFQRSDIDVSLASSSGYTSLITACYKNQVRPYQLKTHILHLCIRNFYFSNFDKISSQGGNSATAPGSR